MKQNVIIKSRKDVRGSRAKDGPLSEGAGSYGPSAYMNLVISKVKPPKTKPPTTKEATPDPKAKAEQPAENVTTLLAQNPDMTSATFLNLLKSKGFVIMPPSKEADMSSGNVAALRSDVKKESGMPMIRTRKFLESQTQVGTNKALTTHFRVVLIEEGMGNFGAGAYYSKEALESGIQIFEGKKIYADHPAESEATERPERSVRDILGHFENVKVEESSEKNGQHWLVGDVVIMGGSSFQWARELMEGAVAYAKKFPDKEFVGLSINASGDSEEMPLEAVLKKGVPEGALPKIQEAKKQGIETLVYVSAFTEAVSCDLVTEAGAGGKILQLIEGEKMKKKNAKESAAEKEAKEKKEAEGTTGDDADKGGHSDVADDMALIKKMIQKHGGDDKAEPTDEECGVVKEAYEASKEMGCKDEEAAVEAVKHLKLAKHLAAKKEAKEAADKAAKEASAGSASDKDDEEDEQTESKGDESKESDKESKESGVKESDAIAKLKADNAKLVGELAAFKESDKKKSLAAHIEKICKESKLTQTVTASFKKLVESAKSVEEVDKTWAVFTEGYRSKKSSAEGDLDFGGMIVDVEKTSLVESQQGSGINFSSCVNED